MRRRDCLLGSMAAGLCALRTVPAVAAQSQTSVQKSLEQIVGHKAASVGAIAVIVDDSGTRTVAAGRSGDRFVSLNARTVFEIGSVTKVLTALLLTEMAERGEVRLDDPLVTYLPAALNLQTNGRPITLLDLANYRSGLPALPANFPSDWWRNPEPFKDYGDKDLYAFLSGYTPPEPPGMRFVYSSLGFALLGLALSRRADRSYETLMTEMICRPLNMMDTSISLSPAMRRRLAQPHDVDLKSTPLWDFDVLAPAGAERSSIEDVTRFLKSCMGLIQSKLDVAMSRLLQTRMPTSVAGTDAALGWFVSSHGQEEIAWKTGLTGGFNTFLGFSTKRSRGALLVTNFLWNPLDVGTTVAGMKLIDPGFEPGDLSLLYR